MAHTYSRPTTRPNTHSLPPRRSVTHNTPQIGPEPDPPKAQSRGLATISSSPEIRLGCSPAASHCRVTRGERPRRVSRLEQRLKLAIEACAHHSERTATRRQPVKPWVGSSASPFSMRNSTPRRWCALASSASAWQREPSSKLLLFAAREPTPFARHHFAAATVSVRCL